MTNSFVGKYAGLFTGRRFAPFAFRSAIIRCFTAPRGAPKLYLLDEEYERHPDEVFHSFRYLQRFEHFVVHDQFHLSVLDVRVLAPRTRRSFRWD